MSFAEDPAKFIGSAAPVSDKIRALAAAGYPRAEIARMLGKRYQHVRNVLEADAAKAAGVAKPSEALSERSLPGRAETPVGGVYRLAFTEDGLIVVPKALEDAMGWRRGGVVIAELGEEGLELLASGEGLRRARALIPQWRPGDPSWADELIVDRRHEAAAEDHD